ncbi:hypothetical protein [Confluentibacter flavum]|uniref:Thiol:disulfide interchange protein DsbD N-terminal domain-containing protein n=1 Tax=Confluentibacter flavum TaxID=1909700 RepID=A0A2N3HI41_9FLAO|nr:hypothetical protein [Confluentibacter flavum]PKQ44574.1 hypothetical protein CSW08_12490 [Confluentibacter flavum]
MSFYNIIWCLLFSLLCCQQKQFVRLVDDDIKINKQDEVISITIPFEILEGYHIQALSETLDNLIPTEITFDPPYGSHVIKYEFVNVHYDTVILNKITHRVLSKEFDVIVTLKYDRDVEHKNLKLEGNLYYQTCNDRQCFFPRMYSFGVTF